MNAFVFPGQGAQFPGMGKDLFDQSDLAKRRFAEANEVLGFDIASTMFEGTPEALKQTNVTQPAIFIHSVVLAECLGDRFQPDMVAGHSLGEFSALVAAGSLSFGEGLALVSARANAMQEACELQPSTMAAVLGLDNEVVETICNDTQGVVVAANYNCPGQLVISGEVPAVEAACAALSEAGARRALMLPVGGAFHSPLMEPAREKLAQAIESAAIVAPRCPIYQNVTARPASPKWGPARCSKGCSKRWTGRSPPPLRPWLWKRPEVSLCDTKKATLIRGGFFCSQQNAVTRRNQPSALSAWAA